MQSTSVPVISKGLRSFCAPFAFHLKGLGNQLQYVRVGGDHFCRGNSNSLQKPCFFRARRARAILTQGPARLRALRASEWPCSLLESDSGPYCNHFLDPYKMQIAPVKHTLRQLTIYFAWKIIVTKQKNEKFLQKATFGPVFLFPGAQSQRPAGHGPQMVTGGPPGMPARGDC